MGNNYGTIAIVAGGVLEKNYLFQIQKADFIIGVDFGAWWLLKQGVVPQMAIGDFDSVSKIQLAKIKKRVKAIKKFIAEKDATDLELAGEEAINIGAEEVFIYGALGGRFDHSLGGIEVLTKLESHNIRGYIVDKFNKIHIVRRLQEKFSRGSDFPYISFIALTNRAVVTLTGFVYNGKKISLIRGSTRGISNQIKNSVATITVHSGRVLAIQSKD